MKQGAVCLTLNGAWCNGLDIFQDSLKAGAPSDIIEAPLLFSSATEFVKNHNFFRSRSRTFYGNALLVAPLPSHCKVPCLSLAF